ncbi:hypothetical protein pb186bvf_005747 [Paramecium bursaria]
MITNLYNQEYGYRGWEVVGMTLLMAFSNLLFLNNFLLEIRKKEPHCIFTMGLTFVCSFMYHISDSTQLEFFLPELEWHRLDDVGSICCIIELMIYMIQPTQELRNLISWLSFILVMFLKEDHAWEIWSSIFPISLVLIYYVYSMPHVQIKQKGLQRKGAFILIFAVICFYKGLNEFQDYLRIWHSLWHIFISFATFYLAQVHSSEPVSISQLWGFQKGKQYMKL